MPTYKLTYFAITGLGEPIRASLALAGIPFENETLDGAAWAARKEDKDSPYFQKQMPALEITDDSGAKQLLFQARAILRYIGQIGKYNGKPLYPADPMEAYYCDECIEMVEDIRPLMSPTFGIVDQAEKETARAALIAPGGKMYDGLVKLDTRLGKFKFAAGDSPSVADAYVVAVCYMFQQPTFLDGFLEDSLKPFPNIVSLRLKLMGLPPLVAYYKDAEGIRTSFKVDVKKRKRWLPLESNPKVVGKYTQKLGFNSGVAPHELLSLEDWALEMIPRPVRAVLLVFPIGKETEEAREAEEAAPAATPPPPNIIHMKQLIGNACGTIALVHVMANLCRHGGESADTGSWLDRFMGLYRDGMTSDDIGVLLEEDVAIEKAHAEAEAESEAKVHHTSANLHFIAFIDIGGCVVELDGRREGPIVRGNTGDFGGDFLAAAVAAIRRHYMEVSPDAMRFNMMALCGGAASASAGGAPAAAVMKEEDVQQLMQFGFDAETARGALEAMGGNVDAAANMLLGA